MAGMFSAMIDPVIQEPLVKPEEWSHSQELSWGFTLYWRFIGTKNIEMVS
jgi:hypothetical protein